MQEGRGTVSVLSYTPEQFALRLEAAQPSFLLAAEGYAAGWRASIDGIPRAVCPANVAFMGVPVAAGVHVVRFEYGPRSLAWGAMISVLGGSLVIWALVLRRRG